MLAGKIIILSAPSGSGKTTIVREVLKTNLSLEFSISATSRKARDYEINGKDYYFISPSEFREKIKTDDFLEWQEVYKDQYYGTLKSEIERITNSGANVIVDIDVFGGINMKNIYKQKALSIFIMPPSIGELKIRLQKRGTESETSLKKRLDKAGLEINVADKFDKIVINNDLNLAVNQCIRLINEFISNS